MTKLKIIRLKPITNGQRHHIKLMKSSLLKNSRIIKITEKKNSAYGRSRTSGNITVWHKQRGAKRVYRKLYSQNLTKFSIVIGISYDPNRSALISLNFDFHTKKFFYNLCSQNIVPGTLVQTYPVANALRAGYRAKLKCFPAGSIISSIGLHKSTFARSAGTQVFIIDSDPLKVKGLMPSGKIVDFSGEHFGTLGKVSNSTHYLTNLGKAGRRRNKGRRPIVRGIAMNPVDHPHGGRTNGGRPSVTPWGLPTKCKFKLKRRINKYKK